jgi:hypothetical protein
MAAIAEAPLAAAPKRFGLGRVVARAFGAVGRNFFKFFTLGLVLGGGPAALMPLGLRSSGVEADNPFSAYTPLFLLGLALYFICGLILQPALIHGAVLQFGGRRPSLGGCIAAGVRSLLPLLAIALLMWLAWAIGVFGWSTAARSLVSRGLYFDGVAAELMPLVAFIVILAAPAAYFMTAWAVVVPAVAIDRVGVFGAFSRSWLLTRNNRWAIFLLGIALSMFAAILFVLSIYLAYGISNLSGLDPSSSVAIGWLVTTPLGAVVGGAGVASVYYELRILKEGADPSRLAEVFD